MSAGGVCFYCRKRNCICPYKEMVGKAYRGNDGIVRWITHFSERYYFTLLWFDEASKTWHSGGIIKATDFEFAEQVSAPKTGEQYRIAGATGRVYESIAN